MAILEVIAHHNLAGGAVEEVVGFMHTDKGARQEIHDLDDVRADWRIGHDERFPGDACEYFVVDATDEQVEAFNNLQKLAYDTLIGALNDGHHLPNEEHKKMADKLARESGENFDLKSLVIGNMDALREAYEAQPFDVLKAEFEAEQELNNG